MTGRTAPDTKLKAKKTPKRVARPRAEACKAGPVALYDALSVADGFEVIVAACIRHFRLNEPLLVEGRMPEALHQCRVAARRLRSALALFRTAIDDGQLRPLRKELSWLSGVLGEGRDLDVFLQRDLPAEARKAAKARRETAYDRLISELESERTRHLMLNLAQWSALGRWRRDEAAKQPLRPFVRARIRKLSNKLLSTRRLRSMTAKKRHHLRIRVKELRYALSFVAGLNPNPKPKQAAFEGELRKLQTRLGRVNDLTNAARIAASLRDFSPIEPVDGAEERELLTKASTSLRRLRKTARKWKKRDYPPGNSRPDSIRMTSRS